VSAVFSPIHLNHAVILDFPSLAQSAYNILKHSVGIASKPESDPDVLLHLE
jgi:hypothetical protein